MGLRERDVEEKVEHCLQGAWGRAVWPIAEDRYGAGSSAVELALALFRKGGIELVERLHAELSNAEESSR